MAVSTIPYRFRDRSVLPSFNMNQVTGAGNWLLIATYTYTNCPTTYGILEVIKPNPTNTSFVMQRITDLSHIYFRYSTGQGTWGNWVTL